MVLDDIIDIHVVGPIERREIPTEANCWLRQGWKFCGPAMPVKVKVAGTPEGGYAIDDVHFTLTFVRVKDGD